MKKVFNWIFGILILVLLIICGLQFYYLNKQSVPECIYIHDTTVVYKDSIIEKIKYRTLFDTIIEFQYKDTIIHDTVKIPIEHKVSEFNLTKDSLIINQKIHHSGYKSTVDSIEIDYKWNYTIQPKKQKKIGLVWNVGLYAGYGINFNNGQYYFSPEIGVGGSIGIGGLIEPKKQ